MATDYPILDESTLTDGEWKHNVCGTVLIGARVHHSVHDGPFPLSGSGEVQVQTVPYCPTCHEEPVPHGAPLHPGDKEWPRVALRVKVKTDA